MFIPRKGQWVLFSLPDNMAKGVDKQGAWRARNNQFCGIYQDAARTVTPDNPMGVITHPPRIMLVMEDGHNAWAVVDRKIVDLWAVMDADLLPNGDNIFALQGCVGLVSDLQPVEEKEDIPPGRRPDIHPRDMHRPIEVPLGHLPSSELVKRILNLQKQLGQDKDDIKAGE